MTQNQEFYFKKNIRAVLHKQGQTSKSGSGDHVHLILGKVLAGANTRVLKELQSKKSTSILKSSFNTAVLNYVGLSYRDYTPSEINKTKKIEIWKHHNIEIKKLLLSYLEYKNKLKNGLLLLKKEIIDN
ncbi:hypothetical protein [Vibrio parahaemolyticus]|uniref:hypothetical protein n=1 Tax=Vibrio parahaemolyticus TaxID=670 RepID=UPI001E34E535|nr:hypothetical protein [Vibrio parahaemolyticus]